MYYVSYGKPRWISNELMDKAVLFASDFLEIDESIEIDFGGEFDNQQNILDTLKFKHQRAELLG